MRPYYDDGQITVYHGDCREVLPMVASASVDFVLTDPPYLVDYRGRWSAKHHVAGDQSGEWLAPAFAEISRVLRPDGLCVSFYGWPQADVFLATWKALGFRPVSHLVWVKNVWGLGYYSRGQHEQAYVLALPESRKPVEAESDVLAWTRETCPEHPTQKPVMALPPVIERYCPPGGLVLDPFMGVGSTLRAAKNLGRRAIGIELDGGHVQSAVDRLAQQVLPLEVR